MNLLRYYLMVGGAGFDAERYSSAASEAGIKKSEVKYIKNVKIRDGKGGALTVESGLPGTFGEGYFSWQTERVNYVTDKQEYERRLSMSMGPKYSQLWIEESAEMEKFIASLKEKLPQASDYCVGSYFLLFTAIYGSFDDGVSVLPTLSSSFVRLLAGIGAGFSADSEPYEVHFSRLKS